LKTHTKMFCDCLNDASEKHPNVNICPICTGHPGTLPVINKKAVELVLKVGLGLGGKVFPKSGRSKFDRKNYFYPDLPKGYQISQYDEPLIGGGKLLKVRIRRIHLEEDAGRLIHAKDHSLVDFNRAGVPLLELVTEPDIKSAGEAVKFAKELQSILRYLDVSAADMEKGQLRVEANVSLDGGTRVELKNINSFRALGEAINFELKRQGELIATGKKVVQETRGWDEGKQQTVLQRGKEEAQDYRYFPEPDLPPLDAKAFKLKELKLEIPELPSAKRRRFAEEFKLGADQVEVLIQDRKMADYFEEAVSEIEGGQGREKKIKLLYNYFTSDLWGLLSRQEITIDSLAVRPAHLAHLAEMISSGEITSRIAKNILEKMVASGLDPHEIIANEKWAQVSAESALRPLAEKVIADNPRAVGDYKKGKTQALQFLVGMVMSELGGRADPAKLKKIFEEILKERKNL